MGRIKKLHGLTLTEVPQSSVEELGLASSMPLLFPIISLGRAGQNIEHVLKAVVRHIFRFIKGPFAIN